ncbi:MAG: hypothetical protein V2I33_04870 [Kangiellaceae bacterium]|jgi:hypothetical protein|nr:hypothetical protein [Kangiellaceae bacterium]
MRNILLALAALLITITLIFNSGEVSLGPGVKVLDAPNQTTYDQPFTFNRGEFAITEFARFSLKAKVLSKENYYVGADAELAPVDLALGWQNMSDEAVLEHIEISQYARFYFWQVKKFPIPRREIETQSANMHLIPSNQSIKDTIKRVRVGDIIELSGSLVSVSSTERDWYWNSSKTRDDTGDGACELILVKFFNIVTDRYNE